MLLASTWLSCLVSKPELKVLVRFRRKSDWSGLALSRLLDELCGRAVQAERWAAIRNPKSSVAMALSRRYWLLMIVVLVAVLDIMGSSFSTSTWLASLRLNPSCSLARACSWR